MHAGFGHKCKDCYFARNLSDNLVCKINGKVYAEKKACGLYRDKPAYMSFVEEQYNLEDIETTIKRVTIGGAYFYANSPTAVLSRARRSSQFPGYASILVAVREDSSSPFGFENVHGEIVWFRYVIGRKIEPISLHKTKG